MTKVELGSLLNAKLAQGSEIVELSRWVFSLFNDNSGDITPELKTILLDLARMEDGEEFELSNEELRTLAERMITSGD